jgi:hypothetical protein
MSPYRRWEAAAKTLWRQEIPTARRLSVDGQQARLEKSFSFLRVFVSSWLRSGALCDMISQKWY